MLRLKPPKTDEKENCQAQSSFWQQVTGRKMSGGSVDSEPMQTAEVMPSVTLGGVSCGLGNG